MQKEQLMEKMRRQSRGAIRLNREGQTRIGAPSLATQRPMLVVLHEAKQRGTLVYSSATTQARHYQDTTGVREDPLKQYQALVHSEPLWDYQREGVDFLLAREASSDGCRGALLCDEMGMGKTRQFLTAVLEDNQAESRRTGLRFNGATLLVCPKHLLDHWRQEAARFPQLALVTLELTEATAAQHDDDYRYSQCDLVLASYSAVADAYKFGEDTDDETVLNGSVESLRHRYKILYGRVWRRVGADEAQYTVVATTLIARGIAALRAERRCALTGTPLQNHLSDVHTLLRFIGAPVAQDCEVPGLLTRLMLRRTRADLQQRQTPETTPLNQSGLMRPALHLVKRVVFGTLPEKMLYYAYARYALQCRTARKSPHSTPVLIHWLRQLCIAPRLVKDLAVPRGMLLRRGTTETPAKQPPAALQRYMDELPLTGRYTYSVGAGYGEGVESVSFVWDPLATEDQWLECEWDESAEANHYAVVREEFEKHGTVTERMGEADVPMEQTQAMLLSLWQRTLDLGAPSSKERAILRCIEEEVPLDDKIIFFSVYVGVLRGMQRLLQARGITCCIVTGKQSDQQNAADIERFKRESAQSARVLLMSLKKANTGLNLDVANWVLYGDEWWQPFIEWQGNSRVQRPGQLKQVRIVRFEMQHTVEQYVLRVQRGKERLEQRLSGKSDSVLAEEDECGLFDYRVTVEL